MKSVLIMPLRLGLEMIEALRTFNQNRQDQVNIRVGINSGTVIMGDIGSKLYRRDYTVIGDSVKHCRSFRERR